MFAFGRIGYSACVRPLACRVTPLMKYASAAKPNESQTTQKQILLKLRKETGFPLAKCKQALLKTNYDVDKAVKSLNEDAVKEGWTKMKNLSGRKTTQGLVTTYRIDNHAILLEINCESDFVAKTPDFQRFVALVARNTIEHFSSMDTEQVNLSPEEILKLPVSTKSGTVQDALAKVVGKLKENVNISRGVVASVNTPQNEFIGIYTHPDTDTPHKGGRLPLMGKYAATVGMKTFATEPQGPLWLLSKARDLAQHVVGMDPSSIGTRGEPQQKLEVSETEEKNISGSESQEDDGNDCDDNEIAQNYVDSEELIHQSFLLDPNITVQNWLDINQLDVLFFLRYQLGGEDENS